jgi:hypothetical protein
MIPVNLPNPQRAQRGYITITSRNIITCNDDTIKEIP